METDANLAALRTYEEEIRKAELLEEMFIQAVINTGILDEYGDLLSTYHTIASKYEMNISFSRFINENL